MNGKQTNPCIRCGKERVFFKTWNESTTTFSGSLVKIVHTQFVCPDADCQKIVNSKLTAEREKREEMHRTKEKRAAENKAKKSRISTKSTLPAN